MRRRLAEGVLFPMILVWICGLAQAADLAPPTGPRDLVVFVAKEEPRLYRLVGAEPVPYGNAAFYNPTTIVADAQRKCFYVIDRPRLNTEKVKLWRIEADGSAQVILTTNTTMRGGPFGLRAALALDAQGRPLIADPDSGIWRLNTDGRLQQLLQSEDKPLVNMAAICSRSDGLIVVTEYSHNVHDTQSGLIETDHRQGGLFRIGLGTTPPTVTQLVENRQPGGAEHDTFWRAPSHAFVDSRGRTVLVDSGTSTTQSEAIYTGAKPRSVYRPERVTTSTINGGILVLHPNGRFEDLTFKNPQGSSGPMRRPTGAAQWSDDTYIVADPEMHVEGLDGSGGLLLLSLDGSRDARWAFGYHHKPRGVAILRGVGAPAQATATLALTLADLAGVRTAGRITRFESASWERKPAGGGGLFGSINLNWDAQPQPQAEEKLRSLFEGARWAIEADGTLHFSAKGITPQATETPLVMRGKVSVNEHFVNALAGYNSTNMFDTQVGSIDARLRRTEPGSVAMTVTITVFTKDERLKGAFEQTLPLATR